MALEYQLNLAGDTPAEQIAERAFPDPAERPTPTSVNGVLSTDLFDQRGFVLSVRTDPQPYVDAASDDGTWEWEPSASVNLTFRINNERIDEGTKNMLKVVARVLSSGPEDAALVINADHLLLTRFDGVIRKHRRTWWGTYDFTDEIIPG